MEIKVIYRNGDESVEISIPVSIGGSTTISTPTTPLRSVSLGELLGGKVTNTFNASELAEAEEFNKSPETLKANEVFGSKLPEGVRYTAVAEASSTAPVDMMATTSTQVPNAPPPPVASSVPVVNPVAPIITNRVTGGELDSEGLPWDSRIHASTRTKNADGKWKLLRGSDPAVVETVKAELRQIMAIPVVSVADAAQVATNAANEAFSGLTAPPAPPATMAFKDLILLITSAGLESTAIVAACNAAGLPNLPTLAQRPDLVETVAKNLGLA